MSPLEGPFPFYGTVIEAVYPGKLVGRNCDSPECDAPATSIVCGADVVHQEKVYLCDKHSYLAQNAEFLGDCEDCGQYTELLPFQYHFIENGPEQGEERGLEKFKLRRKAHGRILNICFGCAFEASRSFMVKGWCAPEHREAYARLKTPVRKDRSISVRRDGIPEKVEQLAKDPSRRDIDTDGFEDRGDMETVIVVRTPQAPERIPDETKDGNSNTLSGSTGYHGELA